MRIDLLLKSRSALSYEFYAAKRVASYLEREKIPYKEIYLSDGILQDYLRYLEREPPAHLLSFTPLLPYEIPLCDFVRIPQCMWLKGSLGEAANFLSSTFGTLALPIETPHPNTFYLPHGVERASSKEPLFDVVSFSPLVDRVALKERWREFFSEESIGQLEQVLADRSSPYEAFSTAHLIEAVEEYRRAERISRLTINASYSLHLFGEHIGTNWYRRLPDAVHLHAPLPFVAHFDLLAQSKIALLDPLDAIWELPAAAAGCLPLRTDQEDLDELIALYLADSKKREKAVESYHEQIKKRSWERQIGKLVEHLYES